jgi:hypothetical protein
VVRRAELVGTSTPTSVPGVTDTIDPGDSVEGAITLTWSAVRGLQPDSELILEVECDDGRTERSAAVEAAGIETWTPGEELRAAVGVVLLGFVWWVMPWGVILDLPEWIQLPVWAVFAGAAVWICSDFYARLWRGRPGWGTALAIGPSRRVRRVTDVLLTSLAVWFLLTAPFAFTTYMIDTARLPIDNSSPTSLYFDAIGLYVWHAVDVLPFVQATDTLNWDEPLPDYSRATGVLLLLYKGLVLAPVVAAAGAAWRGRR